MNVAPFVVKLFGQRTTLAFTLISTKSPFSPGFNPAPPSTFFFIHHLRAIILSDPSIICYRRPQPPPANKTSPSHMGHPPKSGTPSHNLLGVISKATSIAEICKAFTRKWHAAGRNTSNQRVKPESKFISVNEAKRVRNNIPCIQNHACI